MRLTALWLVLILVTLKATAATPIFDGQGNLIGATGVMVEGESYDFALSEATCAIEYDGCDINELSDFPFGSMPNNATLAIVDQVLPGLTSDQIFGCSRTEHPRLSFCGLITPATQGNVVIGSPARIDYLGNASFPGNSNLGAQFDFSAAATRVLVVWSRSRPLISVPAVIDFGGVSLGTQAEIPLIVTNAGTSNLVVTSITVEPAGTGLGWAPGPQAPPPMDPLFPVVIEPGTQVSPGPVGSSVFFFAQDAGPAAATLRIFSNDPSSPVTEISLLGNGIIESAVECSGLVATIVGTAGPDVLRGTTADDVIVGLDGNDLIRGRGGNDTICGGSGDDVIFGNMGDDNMHGEAGDDTIHSGGGFDVAVGGPGADVLLGNGDDDTLDGGDGPDRLLGGGGFDLLSGGSEDDVLIGNGDGDTLNGGEGTDTCDNGAADTVDSCELTRLD